MDMAAIIARAAQEEERTITLTYRQICDLRQPLTTAIGRAQLARLRLRRGDYSHMSSDLRIIEEEGWRLERMLRKLAGDASTEAR